MKIHKKLKGCFLMLVALLIFSATDLYSQQNSIKVTGTVIDEQGEPLISVSVRVKNSGTGTLTDLDGKYTLEAAPSATLIFTYVGFAEREVNVDPSGVVNVTMAEEGELLDEIVVVGYGTQRKKDLTGGLSVVGKEQLDMVSTSNLMDRLTGQVAGLNITAGNAAPGANQTILIRGENSISASNDPLIVLDGIPYNGSLVDLDPNIIDNLSVLKDASAVSIYGSRGSNGVILIQTKRGKIGKPQVSYKAQFGMAEPMQWIEVMGPNEYIRFKQDLGRLNKGYTGNDLDPYYGQVIHANEKENYRTGTTHNWQDYVFQKAFTMDHQVSISGGTEETKYMAAIAYLDQDGVVYNSKLTRTNISVNIDQTFNKWLTIGVGTQFIQKENGGVTPNLEHAIKQSPYGKYKDELGNYERAPMGYELLGNPMLNVNAEQDKTNRNFFLNAYANILLPIKGLSFRTNYGYNYRSGFTGTYYGRNTWVGREAEGKVGGKAEVSNSHYTDYTWENILRYDLEIGDHRIDATGLFSVQETSDRNNFMAGEGFVTDDIEYNNMAIAERQLTSTSGITEVARLAYMLRLNYAYKGKYMATMTGRRDGASVFGANNKYGFFPSAALAWHVAEESFVKNNVDWIDMLKLRLSYGANGNEAIKSGQTLDRLYSQVKYIWGDAGTAVNTAYLSYNGIGNPNLKWETTYTTGLGLDFQFLKGRLGGTIEMYLSNTHDLLMLRTVPIMNGYRQIWDNVGKTRNKGIEITLNSQNIRNRDFTWSTDLNFSLNRDEIVELRGDKKDDLANNWFIGKPLRVFYDYNVVGIWQEWDEYQYTDANGNKMPIQPGAAPGYAKLEDVDGNGSIEVSKDKKIIGSKHPDFRMSMSNRFSYKDFYFSFLLNGVFGVWREDNVANIGSWAFGTGNYVHGANYWTPENPNADIVSPGYKDGQFSHGYYKKLSYLQIKNITLGYKMKQSIAKKLGVSGIDVNVGINNLHTYANMRQLLNYDNGWMASYPTARSYVLGLNVTF